MIVETKALTFVVLKIILALIRFDVMHGRIAMVLVVRKRDKTQVQTLWVDNLL